MPLMGNAVKLHVEFIVFAGALIDPSTIILNIYDSCRKLILGPINITLAYKIGTGIYEYPYVIPMGYNGLYYEFTANPEELAAVARGVIHAKWI